MVMLNSISSTPTMYSMVLNGERGGLIGRAGREPVWVTERGGVSVRSVTPLRSAGRGTGSSNAQLVSSRPESARGTSVDGSAVAPFCTIRSFMPDGSPSTED